MSTDPTTIELVKLPAKSEVLTQIVGFLCAKTMSAGELDFFDAGLRAPDASRPDGPEDIVRLATSMSVEIRAELADVISKHRN